MRGRAETRVLADLLERTEAIDPRRSPNAEFYYIDVSSVSNRTFKIESAQRLKGSDAPSRARRMVRTDDVLFATVRPTLQRVAIVPSNLDGQVCSTGYFVLRPKRGINHRFVFYWLLSDSLQRKMEDRQRGTNYPAVSDGDVKHQEIVVPPRLEQDRIVELLDGVFQAIDAAKANAATNAEMSHSLFTRHVDETFLKHKKRWPTATLGTACAFVRGPFGGSLKKSMFVANGYAVYEQQHAINDQFTDVRYFVDETKFNAMRRFELLPNDLVMSCSGTMGRVSIAPLGIRKGIINQALLKLTPNKGISGHFLKVWMKSTAFQDALRDLSGGAAIQNVPSVQVLKQIRVPLPSLHEQELLVAELAEVRGLAERLESLYEQKAALLAVLKRSVVEQAFYGDL